MLNWQQPSQMSGRVWHPDYGQEVNYELHELPDDPDGQVEATISLMRGYVDADHLSPAVRRQVQVANGYGGDPLENAFAHVQGSMRFKNDDEIHGRIFGKWRPGGMGDVIEVISRPIDTAVAIERGFRPEEDCDGYSTYASALLASQDIPCSYATVGADEQEPFRYSHVYLVAYPKTGKYAGMRVPMDTSHGKYVGWECPNRFGKFREWPVYGRGDWTPLVMIGLVGWAAWRLYKGQSILPALPGLLEGVA